jgi:16S rRNA (uracil1498-N3)-methyltransferase
MLPASLAFSCPTIVLSGHLPRAHRRPLCPSCRPRRAPPIASAYPRGKAAREQGVYVPDTPLFVGAIVLLPEAERRHLRARRARPGDPLRLFDGRGAAAEATLSENGLSAEVVHVAAGAEDDADARVRVSVCVAAPKSAARADWAIEKLAELGVEEMLVVRAARSGAGGVPSEAKLARWARLAVAACKQSMRRAVPAVRCVGDFGDVASHVVQGYDVAVVLSPEGPPLLRVVGEAVAGGRQALKVLVVAGPEGGLTDAEEEALIAGGCVRGALGPGRLRVETAVVAAAAAIGMFADAMEDGKG